MSNHTSSTTARTGIGTDGRRRGTPRLVRGSVAAIAAVGLALTACEIEDPEPGDPGFDDPPADDIGG